MGVEGLVAYVRILQGQSPYVPGILVVWRAQSISSDCARRAHKIILFKSALPQSLRGFPNQYPYIVPLVMQSTWNGNWKRRWSLQRPHPHFDCFLEVNPVFVC
jgi:hypothetical protein